MSETIDIIFILVMIVLTIFAVIAATYASESERLPQNTFDAKRLEDNLEILRLLTEYVENNPSQRFGQVLRNTGVVQSVGVRDSAKPEWETPDYYFEYSLIHEEPSTTLARIEKELARR